MRLYERINTTVIINGKTENIYQFWFLNIPIFKIYSQNQKKKYWFPNLHKQKINTDKPVFYLKINRFESFTLFCIQHWINIVNEMNADFYIVCDNKKLEINVLKKIIFRNCNIKIIKSKKNNIINRIVKTIATKTWYNAAFAHLTPFFHAKENNIKDFYTIDADDTMFLLPKEKCKLILNEVKTYAKKENISAFSLDMHLSRTFGKHWSFGITYINDNVDWTEIFSQNKNQNWTKNYPDVNDYNIDWFFTWLRDCKILKNEIFYVENLPFIHFGDCLSSPYFWGLYIWHNAKIEFLTAEIINENMEKSIINIDKNAVKLDCGIKSPQETSFTELFNNFCVKKIAERT